MKQMTRFLAVAVVLGVMVLGPAAAVAAPVNGGAVASEHSASISIMNLFAKLLGIQPVAQPVQSPTTVSPIDSGSVSTDSAIWGGCRFFGTC
jgi:hypothetical protein